MRVIISGGGTGGHIYPALAIAEQLRESASQIRIFFVGSKDGLENSILANYDYEFLPIEVSGFSRKLSGETVRSVRRALTGLRQAWKIIKKIKPAIVIGTGGYVCGPVVLAAWLSGVKTCIQEQNAVPGVTNRILSNFANKIFLGNPAAGKYFARKKSVSVTGNPIRSDIITVDRHSAQKKLGLNQGITTILVSGGSRGAMSINNAMLNVHERLCRCPDVQVLHITGESGYESVVAELSQSAREAKNIKIVPYMDEMPLALAAADLAVFRAGALGMSELAARGIPSILIPYPYATDNHQECNARSFERENAAILVRDRELTGDSLYSLIDILLKDKNRLSGMADAVKKLGRPDAAKKIAADILTMIAAG
ncbi:MAG: undecaprenyldiphospho-muramoylpentapeptide beta-N-acetylglucosaminyltransferase [Acidaminococcales bacterium]|jgi:UDP-N-acetylglucosamine--N-acetylmuramyl-(pentapeptide) pyrophosphoryl-undecaprenol N-acetylglucosamine transferase|nr:undecaprenyldiphospho-muramoylpentapeptide beta-N-acetylglucosaminyltransferase [Acidaminococcales bacterium]